MTKDPFGILGTDEPIATNERNKAIRQDQGIVPLIKQNDVDLLNIAEAELHQSQIGELQKYLLLIEEAQDINELTAPKILAQLSYGYRKSGEYLALAQFQHQEAKKARKEAEAIAFLDNFLEYVANRKNEGKETKATDAAKAHYINIDQDVSLASRKEALFQAMAKQLETIQMEFMMAISTTRTIAYGFKKSSMMSGTSISVNETE